MSLKQKTDALTGITTVREFTAEEIAARQRSTVGLAPTATDAELAAAQVEVARKAKIAGIEAKTAALLDAGFEFPAGSGHRHSLDDRRISTYSATKDNKNAFTDLPVITNDKKVIRLADAAAIDLFYAAGLARSMAIRVVGAELIEDANAATTTAQLEAIVDDRT